MEDHDACELPDEDLILSGDQKIAAVIQEVLNERFPKHAPYMVTNWQFTATIIDKDGDESLWPVAPLKAKSWTILGMLDYAVKLEQAQMNRRAMED